jgi:hypothetical protein
MCLVETEEERKNIYLFLNTTGSRAKEKKNCIVNNSTTPQNDDVQIDLINISIYKAKV